MSLTAIDNLETPTSGDGSKPEFNVTSLEAKEQVNKIEEAGGRVVAFMVVYKNSDRETISCSYTKMTNMFEMIGYMEALKADLLEKE